MGRLDLPDPRRDEDARPARTPGERALFEHAARSMHIVSRALNRRRYWHAARALRGVAFESGLLGDDADRFALTALVELAPELETRLAERRQRRVV